MIRFASYAGKEAPSPTVLEQWEFGGKPPEIVIEKFEFKPGR